MKLLSAFYILRASFFNGRKNKGHDQVVSNGCAFKMKSIFSISKIKGIFPDLYNVSYTVEHNLLFNLIVSFYL